MRLLLCHVSYFAGEEGFRSVSCKTTRNGKEAQVTLEIGNLACQKRINWKFSSPKGDALASPFTFSLSASFNLSPFQFHWQYKKTLSWSPASNSIIYSRSSILFCHTPPFLCPDNYLSHLYPLSLPLPHLNFIQWRTLIMTHRDFVLSPPRVISSSRSRKRNTQLLSIPAATFPVSSEYTLFQ